MLVKQFGMPTQMYAHLSVIHRLSVAVGIRNGLSASTDGGEAESGSCIAQPVVSGAALHGSSLGNTTTTDAGTGHSSPVCTC